MWFHGHNFEQYKTIMLYLALEDEVSCHSLIEQCRQENKTVLLPYGEQNVIQAVPCFDRSELQSGKWGIQTVHDRSVRSGAIDAIVCPGRFFSLQGQRKGRGSGRYDRFLAQHPESYTIGLCYDYQITDSLVSQPWDIPMNEVIVVPAK